MTDLIDALHDLLDCAEEEIDLPVCRKFVYPGLNAPHDSCEATLHGNGQIWVGHGDTLVGWPEPSGLPTTCAAPLNETVELGIVRCQKGSLQDGGELPDVDLITEDAQRQEDDRQALRRAIMCCWGVEGRDLIVESWRPIPPLGKCVGGVWTFRFRMAGCNC
jgi:hypothetical protein